MSVELRQKHQDGGFEEPNVESLKGSWGSYGDYRLVGRGKVTNQFCGKFMKFKGCAKVELHNKSIFDKHGVLVNFKGKVYVQIVHNWCYKPSCPACFKSGWAVREAGNVEARLLEASKRFGRVEHLVCSVPSKDYGLSHRYLRSKVTRILSGLGVIGGVLIFHGFRYDNVKHWYWSPHFHVLGYIAGGYGRCRHCKGGDCYACGGFEGKIYKLYRENGYIVRIFGERETVFGTAWYQLNHSSYKAGVKRFHIATWFGVCSYRKLKVTVKKRKRLCPICDGDLVKLYHFGSRFIVKNKDASCYEGEFFDDLYGSDGSLNWVEAHSGSYG